jgi:SPW repeat
MATSVSNRTVSGGAAAHVVADPYNGEYAAAREYTAPPSRRSAMAQVAAVLAVLAGVWVAISPWFLTLGRRETASDLIVGLVVAALGAFGIAGRRGFPALQTGSLLLGIWLVITPFILAAKFAVSAPMYWSNGFGGFAVIVFTLPSLAGLRHRETAR